MDRANSARPFNSNVRRTTQWRVIVIVETVGAGVVSALTTHIIKWVTNLKRAGDLRKNESRPSLERVILAVRKTSIYCRSLEDGQPKNYQTESEISVEWSSLGMELEKLKLTALSKKCRVKGWYWEDQGRFDSEFLNEAQVSFEQVERLATQLLRELDA